MKSVLIAFTLMGLLSCASGTPATARLDATEPVEGTYDVRATVPGKVVRGTLQVAADTIYFDAVEGCASNIRSEPIGRESQAGIYRFACEGAVLAFDRRNPVRSSKWYATVRQQRRREVCAERAVRSGREVCVRTTIETYEVPESRSGMIQVTRR